MNFKVTIPRDDGPGCEAGDFWFETRPPWAAGQLVPNASHFFPFSITVRNGLAAPDGPPKASA